MIGHEAIRQRQDALPEPVREYITLSDQVAHDPQDKAEIDEVRFNLIKDFSKVPEMNQALAEFVIFRNEELKRGEKQ